MKAAEILTDGRARWAAVSAIAAMTMMGGSFFAGYVTSVRSDAEFRTRTQTHLEESAPLINSFLEVRQLVAVNQVQINSMLEAQKETNRRLNELVDMMMKEQRHRSVSGR